MGQTKSLGTCFTMIHGPKNSSNLNNNADDELDLNNSIHHAMFGQGQRKRKKSF